MDENFSSRAVKWRWNHSDPTARSSENSPESHRQLNGLLFHCRRSSIVLLHHRRHPSFGSPGHDKLAHDAKRSFKRRCRECCYWKERRKKKEKTKKTYGERERKGVCGQWGTDSPQFLIGPLLLINNYFPKMPKMPLKTHGRNNLTVSKEIMSLKL